jgi:RND family efflux transporter MFP subunit
VSAVYATGTVEPTVMVRIAPRVSARLKSLEADEGDRVEAGQVLVRLDDEEPQAALLEAKIQEALYEQEFERTSTLLARRAISQDEFDKARSRLDTARAARQAAEARLSYMTLRAPQTGTVIRRDGEVGELVTVDQTVMWLSSDDPLRITAEVDEEDIALVQEDTRVLIRADAFPGRIFEGKVLHVTPKGDPVARSYRVRVSVPADAPLRIGMTAETNIIARQIDDALLAPPEALDTKSAAGSPDVAVVWRVKDYVLEPVSVQVGVRGESAAEIIGPVQEGDMLVHTPPADLVPGARVRTYS